MAKPSKKSRETAIPQNGSPVSEHATASTPGKEKSVGPAFSKTSAAKPTKATKPPRAAGKRDSRVAVKTLRTRKPRTATAVGKTLRTAEVVISDDNIRLRAYFIAERRMQTGMPGDSAEDWWEAHRQLLEEARKNN
jgi:Protein of unknown function (DUF2934)